MLIFRVDTLSDAWLMIAQVFRGGEFNLVNLGVIDKWDLLLSVVAIGLLLVVDIIKEHNIDLREIILSKKFICVYAVCLILILTILIFGAYGGEYVPPDPIYGGF